MRLFKAFLGGLLFPAAVLPAIVIWILIEGRKDLLLLHEPIFLPWVWGVWNVFFVLFSKKLLGVEGAPRHFIWGAILGFLVACYGVFVLDIPALLHFDSSNRLWPLLIMPIVYGFCWLVFVRPSSSRFGVHED